MSEDKSELPDLSDDVDSGHSGRYALQERKQTAFNLLDREEKYLDNSLKSYNG